MNGKIDIHEKSINLARRWSVQNENDLMQVSIAEVVVLLEGNDIALSNEDDLGRMGPGIEILTCNMLLFELSAQFNCLSH